MTNSASLIMPCPEQSFLRFGTWSILLHVGAVALLSFLHFSHSVEKPKPLVRVTLVEPQAPTPPKEARPQAPPMLQTQRRQQPVQPQQIMPPPQLRVPTEPTRPAKVTPQPLERQSPQPLKRRILQDNRASDILKLKDFTKVARGNLPPTRTRTNVHNPSMSIPALSTLAALEGISTKVQPLFSPPRVASADTTKTLRSTPASQEGLLKRGVGLKRSIPPVYPRIAKKENWEGTVILRVVVQPNGRPEESITVKRSSGHPVLDEAAIDAVTRWTFYPEKDGNIPIRSVVEIPILFALKQG